MFGSMMASDIDDDEAGDLIQVIGGEDDEELNEANQPDELPILAVRNTVLFPGVLIPITVGRQKSIKVVKNAYKGNRLVGVLAQENPKVDDPSQKDLFRVGTVAKIVKMLVLPDGNTTIIIQGKSRFEVEEYTSDAPYMKAKVKYLSENFPKRLSKEVKALLQSVRDAANKIMSLNPEIPKPRKSRSF